MGDAEFHRRLEVAMNAQWRVWLGRLGALGALTCGVIGLIVGFSDDLVWKLGVSGWFTGGTVAALLAIVMYLDAAAESRNR